MKQDSKNYPETHEISSAESVHAFLPESVLVLRPQRIIHWRWHGYQNRIHLASYCLSNETKSNTVSSTVKFGYTNAPSFRFKILNKYFAQTWIL